MLRRLTTSQVVASQLAFAPACSALLAVVIRYPDHAHRPMPPPGKLLLAFIIIITVGIVALGGAGAQSAHARTTVAIISTIVAWLFAFYALTFVWINTYGT